MNTAEYLLSTGTDEAPVFVDGSRTYTYRELRSGVASAMAQLESLDLPRGSVVALSAPNSLLWIVGYLATMALGFVVVPLPATLTREEFLARLSWLGCRVAILGRAEARKFDDLPGQVVVLGEDIVDCTQASDTLASRIRDVPIDHDAAYLFTSGTTAAPRAVRITHHNIQANTDSILGYLHLHDNDRIMVVLPFSYVFGASLLHTHLRAGAAMVNQPTFVYLESVVNKLADERCTGIAGVPSTFHSLMRNSSFGTRALPDLRVIQQAGGRMSPAVTDEIRAAHPEANLFIMYGQTEATARLSYLPPEDLDSRRGSIGRGIPGVQLRVVDADGNDVAPGEVGEVQARGENISPGYLGDEERTAKKMPNGVLQTGDLATVDDDGFIYVVDRAEDFIKSWGFRIASQDVEAIVMELRDVVSVAAVGLPDDAAGEKVAIVVVPRTGADLDAQAILAHCRSRLSKHMVPEVVELASALPLNSSGKVVKNEVRAQLLGGARSPVDAGVAS